MRVCGFVFLLIILNRPAQAQQFQPPVKDSMRFSKTLPLLQNYYAQHLGFFCKKELQVQKLSKVNVFFRLGSKEYVDYLEQKPNARRF
jgi:hypothetical protein